MKSLLKILCLASLILLSACWKSQPSNEAKDQAEDIAAAMRTMRDVTNAQGEDQLENNEIKDYKRKIIPLLDKDNQKSMLCGILVMDVQNLITKKNMPDHFYTLADQMKYSPEAATEMRDQARDLEKKYQESVKEIVIGSLNDWLFRFARDSMGPLGSEGNKQVYQAVHHECMQKPLRNVKNPHEKL